MSARGGGGERAAALAARHLYVGPVVV